MTPKSEQKRYKSLFSQHLWILIKLRFKMLYKSRKLWLYYFLLFIPKQVLQTLIWITNSDLGDLLKQEKLIFKARFYYTITSTCLGAFIVALAEDN